ncbi:MAG: cob(I)yrinic acid a,c-diamide adenosyltransferase [Bauldia sp.]|nr:cob(I)yrinic acid a,c-diamide adenosyltransferase [Bauldia sp.]
MVALTRIYTRTGDDGTTGLVGNERRSKADPRLEAIGAVDEANAAIGVARIHSAGIATIDAILGRIQNDLFDLGADLATPMKPGAAPASALRIAAAQVERLEHEIDLLNAPLEPLRSFVLPGGSPLAAALHVARTVARRAERRMVALAAGEPVSLPALHFVNRLSDLLFVAARWANDRGAADVLWVPGQNR